jgi:outer membrane protein OmpA-like peptidoglycan-associated protein
VFGSAAFTETDTAAQTSVAIGPCATTEFNVYFEEWKSDLSADARDTITMVQRELQGCTIERVRIIGLAGARGNEDANLNVSMERAQTIAAALEQGGWPKDTFEIAAIGEAGATVDDVTRPMRRRAHVMVDASAPR